MYDKKKDVGYEIGRYCSICGTNTAQFVHETDLEDVVMYECLICEKKDEEII